MAAAKQNEQLLTWLLNTTTRRKRDLGGGFGAGPPIYNRHLPPQRGPNWAQVVPAPPPGFQRALPGQGTMHRYPTYDYNDYVMGLPYGQQQQQESRLSHRVRQPDQNNQEDHQSQYCKPC